MHNDIFQVGEPIDRDFKIDIRLKSDGEGYCALLPQELQDMFCAAGLELRVSGRGTIGYFSANTALEVREDIQSELNRLCMAVACQLVEGDFRGALFSKKRTVVGAIRFRASGFKDVLAWIEEAHPPDCGPGVEEDRSIMPCIMKICIFGKMEVVEVGDWIVREPLPQGGYTYIVLEDRYFRLIYERYEGGNKLCQR